MDTITTADTTTELLEAAQEGSVERCKAAVDQGADILVIDSWGGSLLHTSACKGFSELSAWLLAAGIDPNIQNTKGRTPLHLAAGKNFTDIILHLLKAGANPNIRNNWGITCFQWAVSQNAVRSVKLMKRFKHISEITRPDESLFTPDGKLPYDIATSEEMKRVLLE